MSKRKANVNEKCDAKKFKQATLCNSSKPVISDNWLQSGSLLIYKNPNATASSKVLALDLDNTIIIPASGRVFAKDADDWKFLSPRVLDVLKQYADEGYAIVIISNQGGLDKMKEKRIPEFKTKLEAIFTKIALPVRAYFAISSDAYRKPRIGMWQALEAGNDGVEIDRKASIYCGDAAGRVAVGKTKTKPDHSHCDRLFAENLGVPFKTPEELWGDGKGVGSTYPLLFDPKQLQDSSLPAASPLPPALKDLASKGVNLLLMVGYPASGKSTFCNEHLRQLDYYIVSRDTIKDMKKCVAKCEQLLKAGTSVCIDNTNINAASRSPFLKVAKSLKVPAYACVMQTNLDHSRHNEVFRQLTRNHHDQISSIVFNQMKSKHQAPMKGEGFENIFDITFVPTLASDIERNLYFQYLLEK